MDHKTILAFAVFAGVFIGSLSIATLLQDPIAQQLESCKNSCRPAKMKAFDGKAQTCECQQR